MVRLEDLQPGYINLQIHLLLDERISGAQGFDLGIGQGCLVHILAGAHRGFGSHDLRDELLFVFHRLPQIAVEGALGDVAVNMYLLVAVALADDAALALLQVAGPPGTVQVMEGDEAVLDIRACPHLEGAAHEHPHPALPDLGKQLLFPGWGVGVVDKGDLLGRNAPSDEFVPDVLIDGEGRVRLHAVQQIGQGVKVPAGLITRRHSGLVPLGGGLGLGGGDVTKYKLGQPVRRALLPDAQDVVHAAIDLAAGVVGQHGVDDPLVQAQFPPIRRNLEHVVPPGVHPPGVNLGSPLGELLHHGLLVAGGLGLLHMVLHLRGGEVQLVGGLDVCCLMEHGHEFRQIEEVGEAGPGPVASSLGGQLDGRHRLPKGGGPVVKMVKPLMFQRGLLEIPLHGI